WEPPYRLTISVYITGQDHLAPPLGANVLVIDPHGRRVGMDEAGRLVAEGPNAAWAPAVNPQPNAPIGPRGPMGRGVTLDDPGDGHYVLEISGTHHVTIDLAVAQWDRAGRRRWLHFARWWTEPGAVDRWDIPYTAAARPAFDVVEQRDDSYFSLRAYGQRGASFESPVTELLLSDPRGRRVGHAPGGQREYHDLPRAGYRSGNDDPQEGREIEVVRPPAGIYTLDVTGTAIGSYLLAWLAYDATGQLGGSFEVSEVPTRPGEAHRYQLEHVGAPKGAVATLRGAFGQGARLLSYAAPIVSHVEVDAGQVSTTLVVFYAPTIAPGSFHATLGGHDVSARFRPVAGAHDVVTLPVAPGT